MKKIIRVVVLTSAGLVRHVTRRGPLVVSLAHLLICSETATPAAPVLENTTASAAHAHDAAHAHHVHMLLLLLLLLLVQVVLVLLLLKVVEIVAVVIVVAAPGISHVVPASHLASASPAPVVHARTIIISLVVAPASSV